jgi:hypothetical protein
VWKATLFPSSEMKESKEQVIVLDDQDPATARLLLRFLYDPASVKAEDVSVPLLVMADRYQIQGLVDWYVECRATFTETLCFLPQVRPPSRCPRPRPQLGRLFLGRRQDPSADASVHRLSEQGSSTTLEQNHGPTGLCQADQGAFEYPDALFDSIQEA